MAYILHDAFGHELPLPGVTRIGRDHACQIVLADGEASRFHATLWEQDGVLYLRDDASSNGTFVNGQRVQQAALRPGDQVRIGGTLLVVGVAGASPLYQPSPAAAQPARSPARTALVALLAGGLLLAFIALAAGLLYFWWRQPAAAGPGKSVTILATAQPARLLAPQEFASASQDLAAAVADLNRAELIFIHDAQGAASEKEGTLLLSFQPAGSASTLDADLCGVAAQAMLVAQMSASLGRTAIAQDGGSPAAAATGNTYFSIAQSGYALVVEAQNLRQDNPAAADAIRTIAGYGARLWNPEVNAPGVSGDPTSGGGNPFEAYTFGDTTSDMVLFVDMGAAPTGQAGMLTWLAVSDETFTRTLDLPAGETGPANPFDQGLLDALTTAAGQADGALARQVAAGLLTDLSDPSSQNPPGGAARQITFTAAKGVALVALSSNPTASLPTFSKGHASALAQKAGSAEGLVNTLYGLSGQAPPSIEGETRVQTAQPLVTLSILKASETSRWLADAGYMGVNFMVAVSWQTSLTRPTLDIGCLGGQSVRVTSASGSLSLSAAGFTGATGGQVELNCRVTRPSNFTYDIALAQVMVDVPQSGKTVYTVLPSSTATLTPLPTATLTPVPPTPDKTQPVLETQAAAQKTAEFLATMTEIARLTETASASGVYTLTGTFGMESPASGCYPGTHSAGTLHITADFGHKSASGELSGGGSATNPGVTCNSMTFDMQCSFSYTGSFAGGVNPGSGVLSLSGTSSGTSTCQYTNCKQDGVDVACSPPSSTSDISGPVTVTGTIDKTSLTGKGAIRVCPGCQGDWSAGK